MKKQIHGYMSCIPSSSNWGVIGRGLTENALYVLHTIQWKTCDCTLSTFFRNATFILSKNFDGNNQWLQLLQLHFDVIYEAPWLTT